MTTRCTASPACSPTWPPSAPTTSSPPRNCRHSPKSPTPPHYSDKPSNYSASPTATDSRSQYTNTKPQLNPLNRPNQGELRPNRHGEESHRRLGRKRDYPAAPAL